MPADFLKLTVGNVFTLTIGPKERVKADHRDIKEFLRDLYDIAEKEMTIAEREQIKKDINDENYRESFLAVVSQMMFINNGKPHGDFVKFKMPAPMKVCFYESHAYKKMVLECSHKILREVTKLFQKLWKKEKDVKEGRGKNAPNPGTKELRLVIDLFYEDEKWMSAAEFEEEFKFEKSNAIRILSGLEEKGILVSKPDENFKKRMLYQLSRNSRNAIRRGLSDIFGFDGSCVWNDL
jgi:hypothetical protein